MAEGKEFKPIKEIGSIPISETSHLKFYVDKFRGRLYASIRTFVKSGNYEGPTRLGITLNAQVLDGLIEALSKPLGDAKEDHELARFHRRPGVDLVARVVTYKDSTGVDLREWIEDQNYKGWSKRGVRIPPKDLTKAVDYLKEMKQWFLAK